MEKMLKKRPKLARHNQFANFGRNHDELTLDKLTDPRTRDVIAEAIVVAVKRLYLMDDDDRPTGTYTFADLLAAEEVAGTA